MYHVPSSASSLGLQANMSNSRNFRDWPDGVPARLAVSYSTCSPACLMHLILSPGLSVSQKSLQMSRIVGLIGPLTPCFFVGQQAYITNNAFSPK
ncbi:unnamed protein product [Periconia digitata]|uniref:Uncharacterized protein n=1 Tax=Periconia digitata TaxID=1303443 RepID=A0A9W4UB39_9PLEO|nr:unnamed protein product [Periconia digitata]